MTSSGSGGAALEQRPEEDAGIGAYVQSHATRLWATSAIETPTRADKPMGTPSPTRSR